MSSFSIGGVGNYLSPNDIVAYAEDRTSAADAYILKIGTLTSSLTPPVINPTFPTITPPPAPTIPPTPNFQTIVWTAPAIPAAFTETLTVGNLLPEPFDKDPPLLSFPSPPTPFNDVAPNAPSVNLAFGDPTLDLTLPAPPNLMSISTFTFGGINIPTIDFTVPELTLLAPSLREYTPGASYNSTLLSALKAELEDRIKNGGTGLNSDVEQGIWDRGREREAKQLRDALDGLDQLESLGYSMPPGVFLDAHVKIQKEFGYASFGYSREVAIKQAELAYQATLDALKVSNDLEGKLMDLNNAVENRLFEASKYATQAGVEIYNARVRAYSAFVDAYKLKVNIYEAQVRAELSKVEAFKAQIEAENAKAQINTALVQQYKVQADVALSNIEVYKAEIAAIQTKASIERTKVEVFGEQVKAYTAKINAYTAGVEGFRAQIQAEGSKQDAFKSQVQAYSAIVDAAAKSADAKIEEYKGKISAKNSEWEGYKAQASAESAKANAIAALNSSLAESYKAQVSGVNAYNDVLTKQWQVALDQAQRVTEIAVNTAKMNAELYMTTRSLALDAAKVGAQVSAQLGAAALNAINFSQSNSSSFSQSNSNSSSTSTSTNTNYNFSA